MRNISFALVTLALTTHSIAGDEYNVQLHYGSAELQGEAASTSNAFLSELENTHSTFEHASHSVTSVDSLPTAIGFEASKRIRSINVGIGGALHASGELAGEQINEDGTFRAITNGSYQSWEVSTFAERGLWSQWNLTLKAKAGLSFHNMTGTLKGEAYNGNTLIATDTKDFDESHFGFLTGLALEYKLPWFSLGGSANCYWGTDQMNRFSLYLSI